MKKLKIGVFGATGMVGKELLNVLYDRKFPIANLRLYAGKSAGSKLKTHFGEMIVEEANNADYSELELAFFAIGSSWSEENVSKAEDSDCTLIDLSSAFRYNEEVPLVIPEINPDSIENHKLIASPNCTTSIAAIPLWYIDKNFEIKNVRIATYQATSGAGKEAMEELERETKRVLDGKKPKCEKFQYPIPFNVIPHIDEFQSNGYTKEEMKVVWETRKIFGNEDMNIECIVCARIPTYRVHSEAISVQTKNPVDIGLLRQILSEAPGVEVKDNIFNNEYPMPLTATGKYDVEVGRIRNSLIDGKYGLNFWVCGDQLLKGAALNAVQIGELVARIYEK